MRCFEKEFCLICTQAFHPKFGSIKFGVERLYAQISFFMNQIKMPCGGYCEKFKRSSLCLGHFCNMVENGIKRRVNVWPYNVPNGLLGKRTRDADCQYRNLAI